MKKQAISTSTTFAVLLAILAGGGAVTSHAAGDQNKTASEVSVDNFTSVLNQSQLRRTPRLRG